MCNCKESLLIVVDLEEDVRSWKAQVVDFPEASAVGKTPAEALKNALEALKKRGFDVSLVSVEVPQLDISAEGRPDLIFCQLNKIF